MIYGGRKTLCLDIKGSAGTLPSSGHFWKWYNRDNISTIYI
jgi:hypothetical protein